MLSIYLQNREFERVGGTETIKLNIRIIAATNREGLFLASKAFEGNPYDGHTLQATLDQAEAMTGVAVRRAYADKGYKGSSDDRPSSP